ncbi:MAG: hypothetical protein JXA22_02060 [Candidatus Thermoplasmatota archaeon]|nr:hypothetical protein [Candidatus Thermoplasmatota archaeon]
MNDFKVKTKMSHVLRIFQNHPDESWDTVTLHKVTKLSKSTLRVYCNRLRRRGKIVKNPDGTYKTAPERKSLDPLDRTSPIGFHRILLYRNITKEEDRARVLSIIRNKNLEAFEKTGNKYCHKLIFGGVTKGFGIELKVSKSYELEIFSNDDLNFPYLLPSEFLLTLYFIDEIYKLNIMKDQKEWIVKTIDINRDFRGARLEGLSCLTLQDFQSDVIFKFYNKPYGVRLEASNSYPINLYSIISWINGQCPPELDRLLYKLTELEFHNKEIRSKLWRLNYLLERVEGCT